MPHQRSLTLCCQICVIPWPVPGASTMALHAKSRCRAALGREPVSIIGGRRELAFRTAIPAAPLQKPPPRSLAARHTAAPHPTLAMAAAVEGATVPTAPATGRTLLCTSLVAPTVEGMLAEAQEAEAAGADIVELRVDLLEKFEPQRDLPRLLQGSRLPAIVTFRPAWEGGEYTGEEAPRLAALKYAAALGAAFVDIELKSAAAFFASAAASPLNPATKVIVSSHDYERTPREEDLRALIQRCHDAGADVVKFATYARDISDAATVLRALRSAPCPTIALAMGERGQVTRLLAPKYGGFLTFGALSEDRASAPGQPTLRALREVYGLQRQGPGTKVFGVVGNPVNHSRSPALHNAAMQAAGFDGVYVPLLVDDIHSFLDAFPDADWAGLSVTIPHKGGALSYAAAADPVATQIGAANTLVRQPDGSLRAYNTDWSAAIAAIERGLGSAGAGGESPLKGRTVVVVGAGGAGRALAFGAAERGADVVIANRSVARAQVLAGQLSLPARSCSLEDLASGAVTGDVLANTTSVGMQPNDHDTPVPAAVLPAFKLVFDSVYTPRHTRLLKEAAAAGCAVVTGDEMFVGQAADQFKLFTGLEPPVELMQKVVLESLGEEAS